ncbi:MULTISPECIES: RnfABCDGE type electron transport complex subunit C [Terrabacteria group]|uniref:RnfABCDGE type electron transport complex subunit C n=1 Tax=Bacillati TaxID=1783272 RepID=UPI001C6F4A30|nr:MULTISPECIES: RnfABCDGE type electron transport complex subunit C [Terrabacteria group]MBW9212143.1 RnfABCDGE type electron transport complex subunit C [Trueperella sp. zg.1013]
MKRHLDGHKDLTTSVDVNHSIDPNDVWVPIASGSSDMTVCVEIGSEVKIGTKLAERNDHFYLPVFSPVSGTVTEEKKMLAGDGRLHNHLHIVNNHKNESAQAFKPLDYTKASREELLDFVKNAGVLGLGGAGFPTYVKYTKVDGIEMLVINAVECEPFLTADYKAMEENMDDLKLGVLALGKLSKATKVVLAIKENKKAMIAKLKETFAGTNVEIKAVPDVYPMGYERTLAYQLTKKNYDRLPSEIGLIINNANTAIALGKALVTGMPITHKYVTVSGDAVKNPQTMYAPVGTTSGELLKVAGGVKDGIEDVLLINGGPMMGRVVPNDQWTISQSTNGVTVMKHVKVDAVNCLRCGACVDHCPMGLEPVRIADEHKVVDYAHLVKLRAMDCIECGLCTYVCPSKIDVTEKMRRAKTFVGAKMKAAQTAKGGK